MKADLSRDTYSPENHYQRVLMQQGRVIVDADWNEQAAILIRSLQQLATDLIGPYGGPQRACGFKIEPTPDVLDLTIGSGRYYVDGILCENEGSGLPDALERERKRGKRAPPEEDLTEKSSLGAITYRRQPNFPLAPNERALPERRSFLAYLDVWERHLTYIDDDRLRENALGVPDNTTRTKVVWQVRIREKPEAAKDFTCAAISADWRSFVDDYIRPSSRGRLTARTGDGESASTGPRITPPPSGYRGQENHLYRVEIFKAGQAGKGGATFVWSRANGSIASGWKGDGDHVVMTDPPRDDRLGFHPGDWIELTDDFRELRGEPGRVARVRMVEDHALWLEEGSAGPIDLGSFGDDAKLRRWDSEGAVRVEVPAAGEGWIALENGLEIRFEEDGEYQTGDYWLLPTRTVDGVQWPHQAGRPKALRPHGIDHHYAPLAVFTWDEANETWQPEDCRCCFASANETKPAN